MRYPVAQVAPSPCWCPVSAWWPAALLLDEHPLPCNGWARVWCCSAVVHLLGARCASEDPNRGLTSPGNFPSWVRPSWAHPVISAGCHHQESKDMRHPSLSIIPLFTRHHAGHGHAAHSPFCWSPFGWSATLPADLKWESNDTRSRLCRPRGQARRHLPGFHVELSAHLAQIRAGFQRRLCSLRARDQPAAPEHPSRDAQSHPHAGQPVGFRRG